MKNNRWLSQKKLQLFCAFLMVAGLLLGAAGLPLLAARAQTTNLALNKPATCSSTENASFPCASAVDGNTGTRWSSAFSDPQWIQVDLGATYTLSSVILRWEPAYATAFQIQTSGSATGPWTNIYSTTTGTGGTQTLTVSGSGRYVRMNGTARATQWGYSLWEFEVYGTSGGATATRTNTSVGPSLTPTRTATRTNTPIGPTATRTRTPTAPSGGTNLALNKPVTCSSIENTGTPCASGVDGNTGTRWSSAFSDPQWIQVDLGSTATIGSVILRWEAAYATAFQIQTSGSATGPWTNIYSTTTGTGGTQTINAAGSGRYVRMNGTARATAYGYSLWEFEVYGSAGPTNTPGGPTPTRTPTVTGGTPFWDTSNIPAAQNVMTFKFLNRTNGHYPDSQVYWSFNGQVHTIAEQSTFDMPANSAGRMYFGLGVAPNAANPNSYWDFIEFTIGPTQFNGNTTRVDAFGLKLAMRLHNADGTEQTVGENLATFTEDRATTFQRYLDAMPTEFDGCANVYSTFRIVEPGGCGFNAGGAYATYYDSYVNTMWANNGITIPKPGPNGSGLAAYPDLSAAIFRHVGAAAGSFNTNGSLLNQSLWANASTFYTAAPAMYYAKFWHDNAYDGKAYGFPYDDVGGYSSYISHNNPQYMLVAIGW